MAIDIDAKRWSLAPIASHQVTFFGIDNEYLWAVLREKLLADATAAIPHMLFGSHERQQSHVPKQSSRPSFLSATLRTDF